jgi:hypothetical protein
MKVYTHSDGRTVITGDEVVIGTSNGESSGYLGDINVDAPNWSYTLPSGEIVTVDVSSTRPNLDSLASLYERATKSKRPEDAAAYLRHKTRVLALFKKRDIDGERYE